MQCRTRGRHPALHVVMRWRRDAGVQAVGMQAQARESFGGAASGAPSQCVAVAFICGSAASMAASAGLGCQARRLVRDELHFLEVRHLLFVS